MARQAAIMALKNRILVDAHTDPEEFDVPLYRPDAVEILEALARESDEAAERTRRDRDTAVMLKGRGMHQHDYRRRDVGNLTLREESFEGVARELRAMCGSEVTLDELITDARDRAWRELAREMERVLDRKALLKHGDARYQEERENRLRDFVAVDLFALQMMTQHMHATDDADDEGY
ncbi:MAG TPA: asparagine synthase [Microbacteriaceae bacterium]|nr:asparagine synthase [Microbacteriaceae bacterium]